MNDNNQLNFYCPYCLKTIGVKIYLHMCVTFYVTFTLHNRLITIFTGLMLLFTMMICSTNSLELRHEQELRP